MYNESIPLLTYVFVGATALALAAVTILDKSGAQTDNNSTQSSTSMLPNIFSSKTEPEPTPSLLSTIGLDKTSTEEKVGGKKHRTRSNRKNRSKRMIKN
jgi:hypothetical protein